MSHKAEQAINNITVVKQNLNRIALSLRITGNERLATDLELQGVILDLAVQSLQSVEVELSQKNYDQAMQSVGNILKALIEPKEKT